MSVNVLGRKIEIIILSDSSIVSNTQSAPYIETTNDSVIEVTSHKSVVEIAESCNAVEVLEASQDVIEIITSGAQGIQGEDGLGLTPEQASKLEGIEEGAQVNVVDSVSGRTGDVVLSKSDVGLSAVDNTADADKPVSVATQTALDGKADSDDVFSGAYDDLTGKPTIPTDNSQLINGAEYITASSTDALTNKSGSNSQWANDENYVVEDNVLASSLSSGMISGGAISVNAADNTKFDISSGVGVIIDNWTDPDNPVKYEVTVDATGVDVTNITTQNQTHVLLMPDGSIDQREQPPSASARRNCIYLGQIGHGGRTVIQGVLPRPDVFASPVSQLRDLMYALGAINLGVTVSAGGGLTISRNAGQIFLDGANAIANPLDPHLVSLATESPKLLVRRTQTGQGTNSTDMDVGNYDVGGVVTPITGNKYQNMRAYQFGNGNLLMQYGQATYNSLANAVEAIQTENFIPNSGTAVAAVLVGIISVRSTATDLSDPAQAQFSGVSMFGDASVTGSSGGGVAGLGDSFETVSKNLKVSDSVLSYSGDVLNSIVYATSGGGSITKTLNYTGNLLTSITLSGDTPTGIDLTKTLSYTGGNLTGVTYS